MTSHQTVTLRVQPTSRTARFLFHALHASGDSDNSGTNGDLHVAILLAALWAVLRVRAHEPTLWLKAEGDDSQVAHRRLETVEQADRIAAFFTCLGLASDFAQAPLDAFDMLNPTLTPNSLPF